MTFKKFIFNIACSTLLQNSFRKDSRYNPTMTFILKKFAGDSDLALILQYNSNMLVLGISFRHYSNYLPFGPFNLHQIKIRFGMRIYNQTKVFCPQVGIYIPHKEIRLPSNLLKDVHLCIARIKCRSLLITGHQIFEFEMLSE